VGVRFQFEQEANLGLLVQAGMGVRIPMQEFSGERVLADVTRVADDPSYKQNATPIQSLVRTTDGAQNAAEAILNFITNQSP
jgi:UDP:flavonoid glycosyltransferase YjiC (YdhE family)